MAVQIRPDEMIRLLRPEFVGAPGTPGGGLGGWLNKIYQIPSGTGPLTFHPKTSAGVDAAMAAASAGDALYFPDGTYTGDHTFTDVELWGAGRDKTIFTGEITLVGDAVPNNLSVVRTANDANDLIAVRVSANETPTGFFCDFLATQSGAGNAYGVYVESGSGAPKFEYCTIDGQSTGGSGYGVYQDDEPEGPATVTVVYNNGNTTFADSFNFSAAGIGDFVWKIDYDWASLPANGEFRVRLTLNSGTGDPLDIYNLDAGTDATAIDAGYTPWLNNTLNQYNFDGETFDHASQAPFTPSGSTYYDRVQFSDGASENTNWTMSWMRWYYNAGADYIELFAPAAATTAVTKLRWCKVNGSTTDLDATSGEIQVYACEFDNSSVNGTITYLEGDRAAYTGVNHSGDWDAGDSHHAAVTLGSNATSILDISAGQQLTFDDQINQSVFVGPSSGSPGPPSFSSLTNNHLPSPIGLKTPTTKTIDSGGGTGAISITQSHIFVAAESGTTDDLDTISGGQNYQFLMMQADAGDTITVKHGVDNITLNGETDFEMSGDKTLLLFYDGTNWSDIGAGGGGGGGHEVQDEGTPLTQRAALNFVGAGVTVTDDAGNDASVVTIPGYGTSKTLQTHTVLHQDTLASAGQFDISAIPQDYDHLILRIEARGDVTAVSDWLVLWFNNDTTATNYSRSQIVNQAGTLAGNEADTAKIADIPAASSPANNFATVIIEIHNYTSGNEKTALSQAVSNYNLDDIIHGSWGHHWENTAAINRITLTTDNYSTDKLETGSYLEIIGVREEAVGGAAYSAADVSNPPTDAQLDSEFGTPATVGAGFLTVVDDAGAGTNEYLVWSDGTNWFYATGTKAT